MRKFSLTAALAVAALGFASLGSAQAQVIVNGGYQQGYYGYTPYGSGIVLQSGGSEFYYGSYPSYGYTYPSYGYTYPAYSGYSNYSPALSAYYSFYRRGAYGNTYNYGGRRGR